MKKTTLIDKSKIFCISSKEAQMLYEHIHGYFDEFISIKKGDTIVDIGANIGILGIELSKKFNNDISIIAFEPIKEIFDVLEKNALNTKNNKFQIFQLGISNKNSQEEFTYYPNMPALSSSNNEIWESKQELMIALKGNLNNAPKNWWWVKFIPNFLYPFILNRLIKNPKKVICTLKKLSDIIDLHSIKKINLLKIDCEGNELKVLEGINHQNWEIINQLIIEVHNIDNRLNYIKDMLTGYGYKIQVLQEPSLKNTKLYNLFAKKTT
tara:strand:+ start:3254 stop:4054 length:801 start_codon:yes stop_codon:yes gene_type:complete